MSLFNTRSKESVEKDLELYERRRKLEIDEKLSDYRRTEKNRAVEDVKSFQDSRIASVERRAKDEATYNDAVLEREKNLARLDGEIKAREGLAATAESHRKLTAEARKETAEAERKNADVLVEAANKRAEKAEGEVTYLRGLVEKYMTSEDRNSDELVKALGKAASQDHSTKVIGLGLTAQNAERKS